MRFDLSLIISACALALSVWNAVERHVEKQPRIFVSDANVSFFNHSTMKTTYVRFDLTINSLSSEPIPISRASISMDTMQSCDCMYRSPTPHTLVMCSGHADSRNQELDDFFGPGIRLPATLSPLSAQHICLWLCLPDDHELLCALQEAAASSLRRQEESSKAHMSHKACAFHGPYIESVHSLERDILDFQKRNVLFHFQSGNRRLPTSSAIDMLCFPLLPGR